MLTKEQILEKCNSSNLDDVRNINLWGCDLDNIDIIADLPNVEMVSLSCNNISSLKPFSSCARLRELYLRRNKISDPNEFKYLSNCKELKILWLEENPVCSIEDYRTQILNAVPQLIKLDNVPTESGNQYLNEVNQPINTFDSISNANETKHPLRMTHSAIPKHISSPHIDKEEKYWKKLDNIDDIKNFFSNGYCSPGNINTNINKNSDNNNISNININSNNLNEYTTNTLSSNNSTNKKDYLVSETLLNAQQMKFTTDNINQQPPVKVFKYDINGNNQKIANINRNNNKENQILNHLNRQYANNDININYHNFKQVPLNNNSDQQIPFESKNSLYQSRDSQHNIDPIPISDSLSNISPRNYHLMTAILNLIEDLSVKELIYVRSKIVNLLGDPN